MSAARCRTISRLTSAAILSHEVVQADGVPRLAAGHWATGQRATLNPGYWAVPILRDLARRTHERRWDAGAACRARP